MYDEIINEILQEREDVVRIAQTYKSELDRIVISDCIATNAFPSRQFG